jgi:hypothetical protein
MMTLALMRVLGWDLEKAKAEIQYRRYVVDWAEIYVQSVEHFMQVYEAAKANSKA